MELIKLDKNTAIKNFAEIYNSNNSNLIEYIELLLNRIESLEIELNKYKSYSDKKFANINKYLGNYKEEKKQEAEIAFVNKFNYFDDKMDEKYNLLNKNIRELSKEIEKIKKES